MHVGCPSHRHAATDRSILLCPCGWVSDEMDRQQVDEFGLPWICRDCGDRVFHVVIFAAGERTLVAGMLQRAADMIARPDRKSSFEIERMLRRDPYYGL